MNSPILKSVGEVCDFVGGSQPAKSYFSSEKLDGYIRLIQIRDYKTDNFKTYIPINSTKKLCSKEDIMIGRYGPPIFQILRGIEGAYNVALMKAVPKENITNDYLYYFLCQKELFNYINALSPRTGGQTGVDVVMLKKYPIKLPQIDEQKQIAKILSDLDAKIEINNKINQELETLTKTIYDYWFVQFDFPDANGKPYRASGGKMIYNTVLKIKIPEGWKSEELNELVEMGKETVNPSLNPDKKFNHISIPVFDKTETYSIDKGSEIASNKFIVTRNDIAVSKLNPWFNRVFYPLDEEDLICTTEMIVWKCEDIQKKNFFYQLSKSQHFITYSIQNATGTSNSHRRVNPTIMMKYKIPYSSALINKYGDLVSPWIKKIMLNKKENQKLSELRDWLLPMLMNGQITVKEAQEHSNKAAEPH